jgi:hypothetical protein
VPFEKVKSYITQRLTAEKQKETFDKFMEGLKKNYKVEINKNELAKISSPAPAGPAQPKAPEQKK